jgi:hypothetical protein
MSNVAQLRPPTRTLSVGERSVGLRLSLIAVSCFVITYYALHHGSYSLIDRQQMAVFVWVAIGVAAISGVLPAVRPPRVLLVPLAGLLLMAAWTLLSLTWTESAERSFAEFARIVGYLGVVVLVWIGVGRATWRLVAAGLLSAGVLVCFLVVLSRLWPGLFPSDFVALRLKTTRINYPFGYWNAVGCWCAMTITLCLAWAAHARSGIVRGLALAAVPMCSVGLYLALSRAGFGGALLGAVAVVLLAQWRWLAFLQTLLAAGGSYLAILAVHQRPELVEATGTQGAGAVAGVLVVIGLVLGLAAWAGARHRFGERLKMHGRSGRVFAVVVSALAIAAVLVGAIEFGGRAYDEFTGRQLVPVATGSSDRLAQLNGNRHNIWDSAWAAFEAHPVTGIGPGTFEFWWSRNGANGEFLRDVHNVYLEALAETGVIGFIVLLVFLLGLLWSGLAARGRLPARAQGIHGGLIAVFVGFLFQAGVDWMWESTAITVFALVAIAVAGAAASEPREGAVGAMGPLALMLVSALAVIVMFAGLATRRQIEMSQAAFNAGRPEAALQHADNAINAQRWSAKAWGQRALALEELGRYHEALVAVQRAERIEPYNWRWPLVAAKIYVGLGDPVGAATAIGRAEELRPWLPFFGRRSVIR